MLFTRSAILLLCVQIISGRIFYEKVPAANQKGLKPLNDFCGTLQRAFDNLIMKSDRCLFVSMDHIHCPLTAGNTTVISVSLDQMFTGLILKHQKLQLCEKVLAFFQDFNTFRYFIRNKNLQLVFQPFTRILVFSLTNEQFEGILDRDTHKNAIMYNGLFMNFGRFVNESYYEIEDVLTEEKIGFSKAHELEEFVQRRKGYIMHPLFNMKNKVFNVSLFHCPPHVIKLDNRMGMDR